MREASAAGFDCGTAVSGSACCHRSGKSGLDPALLARIPARMKEFVDAGKAAGIVTLVARRGSVAALDAVGYTDVETRQPMKTDNMFQLHSMTKPVVAIAAMMLVEEGRLTLTDPVEKYLPEFRGIWVIDTRTNGQDDSAPAFAPGHCPAIFSPTLPA